MNRIYAAFDGEKNGPALGNLCLQLLTQQKASWPDLNRACQALKQARSRDIACDGFSVRLLHNPGRLTSTTASVNSADIDQRPCFLCGHNLPDRQKGILYRNEYLILVNPMPVASGHLTIPHLFHRPQAIAGNMHTLLGLAADLGEEWMILYNGPRCGASAPDHLHFQAIPAGRTPIEQEVRQRERLAPYGPARNGVLCRQVGNVGRDVILFAGKEADLVVEAVSQYIETLTEMESSYNGEEPMINMMACLVDRNLAVLVFPRQKHRPDAFFREEDDRITVSPAVVEMAGIIITPFEKDFERLDATAIEDIYREVSFKKRGEGLYERDGGQRQVQD